MSTLFQQLLKEPALLSADRLEPSFPCAHSTRAPVCSASFLPDGTGAISALGSIVFLHDLQRCTPIRTKRLPSPVLSPLALPGDCKQGLGAGIDRARHLNKIDVKEEVTALAFAPDGKRVATGGKDIRLWDVDVKKP